MKREYGNNENNCGTARLTVYKFTTLQQQGARRGVEVCGPHTSHSPLPGERARDLCCAGKQKGNGPPRGCLPTGRLSEPASQTTRQPAGGAIDSSVQSGGERGVSSFIVRAPAVRLRSITVTGSIHPFLPTHPSLIDLF